MKKMDFGGKDDFIAFRLLVSTVIFRRQLLDSAIAEQNKFINSKNTVNLKYYYFVNIPRDFTIFLNFK